MPKKDFGPFDSRREAFAHMLRNLKPRSPEAKRADTAKFRERYFDRLDARTRQALEAAEDEATLLGADLMDTGHLLAGLLTVITVEGLSIDDVRPRLTRGFSPADIAALATLGIALDDIVERAEDAFGANALAARPRYGIYRVMPSFEFIATWSAAGAVTTVPPEQIFAAILDPTALVKTSRAIAILSAIGFDIAQARSKLPVLDTDRPFFRGRGVSGWVMRAARWLSEKDRTTEQSLR